MSQTIGEKIKAIRIQAGLSQDDLSEAAQLSVRTIQRIENGETEPRGDSLKRIANALNIDVNELTAETGSKIANSPLKEDQAILLLLHLSAFGYLVYPFLGIILPLIVWIYYKNKVIDVDQAGKRLMIYQIVWCLLISLYPVYYLLTKAGNISLSVHSIHPIIGVSLSLYVLNALYILSKIAKLLLTKRPIEDFQ